MKKDHIGSHNDYDCYKRIKKAAKRISTKNTRNYLKRNLKKDIDSLPT